MAEFVGKAQSTFSSMVFDLARLQHNDALYQGRRSVSRLFHKAECVNNSVVKTALIDL